jgi:hypothetical protein
MNTTERKEFQDDIRRHLESGKLTDELFADMALLFASLNDPTLDGARLTKYETREGWAQINSLVRA